MGSDKPAGTVRQPTPTPAIPANEVVETLNDALTKFLGSIQTAHQEAQRPLVESSLHYAQTLQSAAGQPDAAKQIEAAYNDYVRQLSEAPSPELQRSLREAYQQYLSAIKGTFAQAEIESVPATTLAGIGQSLYAAALYAGAYIR